MRKIFIFSILVLLISLAFINTVSAEDTLPQATTDPKTTPPASGTVSLTNPLGEGRTDVPTLLGTIINNVLGIIGSLALAMFIYGGAIWMLSAGNQEQVTKGKNILIWAAVGLVIIFTAYAIVRYVLLSLTGVNPM